ncbi:hypothetical protein CXB35_10660 [Pseudomonas syringae]|nr:hypothetical protein CXB35_10660 [Pseudomonas syringae]
MSKLALLLILFCWEGILQIIFLAHAINNKNTFDGTHFQDIAFGQRLVTPIIGRKKSAFHHLPIL